MEKPGTKEAAESVLRELPSVVGVFVREDAYGHPREIHLLIAAGPKPRHFAQDVKDLLEERLGIPIDQRIISIAQLAGAPTGKPLHPEYPLADAESAETAAPQPPVPVPGAETVRDAAAGTAAVPVAESGGGSGERGMARIRFLGSEAEVAGNRVTVRVRLARADREYVGVAVELDAGSGRSRAAARAALAAATHACEGAGRFELDAASVVRVLERDYAIVSTLAASPRIGRRSLVLAGAHPLEEQDAGTAAALAALKSANRVLALMIRDAPGGPGERGSAG